MKKTILIWMLVLLVPVSLGFFIDGFDEFKNAGNIVINASGLNAITFWTNDVERLVIDSSGNLGVGASNPSYKLTVEGNLNVSTVLNVSGNISFTQLLSCDTINTDATGLLTCGDDETGAGSAITSVWNSTSTEVFLNDSLINLQIQNGDINNPGLAFRSDANMGFFREGTERVRLGLGDGTFFYEFDNSALKLHNDATGSQTATALHRGSDTNTGIFGGEDLWQVSAGGLEFIRLEESGNDIFVINDDSGNMDFRIESNNNEHILFIDGGNDKVGIGNSIPNATLHISGSLNASGNISFTQLLSCDTINTDATGLLTCGNDADSGAGSKATTAQHFDNLSVQLFNSSGISFTRTGTNITINLTRLDTADSDNSGTVCTQDIILDDYGRVTSIVTVELGEHSNRSDDDIGDQANSSLLNHIALRQLEANAFKIANYSEEYSASGFDNLNFSTRLNTFMDSFFNIGNASARFGVDYAVQGFDNENDTLRWAVSQDSVGFGNINWSANQDDRGFDNENSSDRWAVIQDAQGYTDTNVSDVAFGAGGGDVGGTANAPTIDANAVDDTHIDFGTGANQVSLVDFDNDVGFVTNNTNVNFTQVNIGDSNGEFEIKIDSTGALIFSKK